MSAIILVVANIHCPLGVLSDVIDGRKGIMLCSFTAAGLSLFNSISIIDNCWLFYSVSFFFGGFIFTLYALSVAHTNDCIDADNSLGAAQGLLQLYGIGAIIGPLLTSQALEYFGPKGMLIFFATIMTALGMFTLHRMHYRSAPSVDEQHDFIPLARTSPVALEMSSLNEPPVPHENND